MKSSVFKLLVCLLVLSLSSCDRVGKRASGGVTVGSRAPDFSLKSLDGVMVKSRSYEGNIVILNFWATWCQPCRKEIPILKQLTERSEAKVVGIALDQEGLKAVKPFVEQNGINYTVLLGDEDVFRRFNGFAIPYTLVLDPKGEIVKIYRGPTTKESLEQDLEKIRQGSY